MPYSRYLLTMAGRPNKISTCSHCAAELQPSPALAGLLASGSCVIMMLFFVVPDVVPAPWRGIGTVLILSVASVFLFNFLGWLLIGWRKAPSPATKQSAPSVK